MSTPVLPTATRPTRHDPLPDQPVGVAWPTIEWPTAPVGPDVDRDRLAGLMARAFGNPDTGTSSTDPVLDQTLATVVIHGGRLVAEAYGPDTDADTTLISWSMAKSITQAMVGLLVGDGLLDLDRPAPVARWADDHRRTITLRHLLTMTSGLEFVEDYVDDQVSHVIEMLFGRGADDVAAYAESFPLVHPPGSHHSYSSGTTNIVSAICGRAIGPDHDVVDYLQTRLFDPIGMTSAIPKCDPAGTFIGSSFVYATARDFARFGCLYLRDGRWDGERLLPEGWLDVTRQPVDPVVDEACWYGGHWWLWDDSTGAFACHGYEGQYTVVVPGKDLVIVRLGKTHADRGADVRAWLAALSTCFPDVG